MLYITTRNKYDAYTAHRAITQNVGPDGGPYLPFQMPKFSPDEIEKLGEKSFGTCMAEILNLFFSAGLTGWDLEFSVGRYPARITPVANRIFACESWRNLDGSYEALEQRIAEKICKSTDFKMTSWLKIAVRIAVMFGVFGQMLRQGTADSSNPVDVSVPAGDFSLPMALWYGRQMGLPIANIICSCGDNSALWELLHLGELRTGNSASMNLELERLIFGTMGIEEAKKFQSICQSAGTYTLVPYMLEKLKSGLFAAVISSSRLPAVISSVYRTASCVFDTTAAISYGGLMDYRTKTGESRTALLISDINPADQKRMLADTLKISDDRLQSLLDRA